MATFGFRLDDTPSIKLLKVKSKFEEIPIRYEDIDQCILRGALRDNQYIRTRSKVRTQPDDPRFPHYNANTIGKTHYIAAEGPTFPSEGYSNSNSMGHFLESIPFNKAHPIKVSMRVGQAWGLKGRNRDADFFDYAMKYKALPRINDRYEVIEKKLTYGKESLLLGTEEVYRDKPTTNEMTFNHIESKKEEGMIVYDYPAPDGEPLALGWFASSGGDDHRAWFYEMYKRSEGEEIVVHCASGLGRTIEITFVFLLMDYFEAVFVDNLEETRNNVELLISFISMHRYILMSGEQKKSAIEAVVYYLRDYELSLSSEKRKDRSKLPLSFEEIRKQVAAIRQDPNTQLLTDKGKTSQTYIDVVKGKQKREEEDENNRHSKKRRNSDHLASPTSVHATVFHHSSTVETSKECKRETPSAKDLSEDECTQTPEFNTFEC